MRTWVLTGASGQPYESAIPGTLGGHRHARIYGRLDCTTTRRAAARGGYVRHHIFFLNETGARNTGYRPCAMYIPQAYAVWRGSAGCG